MISSTISRCYILMNAGTFNTNPPENTVPPWLLPCICNHQRCQCNARFKPNILCVRGIPYQQNPPLHPNPNIIIQFIEFTYCNDRFSTEKVASKTAKYQPLLNSIQARGWNVAPILIIIAGAHATTHTHSITNFHKFFKIPLPTIKQSLQNINTIAIHHAMSILLHKRRLENNQSLPIPPLSP
jgi:hypothetical protein